MNSLKTVIVNLLLLFYFHGLFKCFEISYKSCAKFFSLLYTIQVSGGNGLRFINHWNEMEMKAIPYIIPLSVYLASFQRQKGLFWETGSESSPDYQPKFCLFSGKLWSGINRKQTRNQGFLPPLLIQNACSGWKTAMTDKCLRKRLFCWTKRSLFSVKPGLGFTCYSFLFFLE